MKKIEPGEDYLSAEEDHSQEKLTNEEKQCYAWMEGKNEVGYEPESEIESVLFLRRFLSTKLFEAEQELARYQIIPQVSTIRFYHV
jgi:predicted SpoU family rRNA methylase